MKKQTGYIVHEDTFRVAILTGFRASKNVKTGAMLQLWILVKAHNPIQAVKLGTDQLVCGDCPHRGTACYVDRSRAPLAIWRKYSRGGYPVLQDYSILTDWAIRLGAYGDPAYVPLAKIQALTSAADDWTGYTHQWRQPWAAGLKPYTMASVDSHEEQIQATRAGWKTFRVQLPGEILFSDESRCPASKEAGHKVQCDKCRQCNGKARRNRVINVHGAGAGKFSAN